MSARELEETKRSLAEVVDEVLFCESQVSLFRLACLAALGALRPAFASRVRTVLILLQIKTQSDQISALKRALVGTTNAYDRAIAALQVRTRRGGGRGWEGGTGAGWQASGGRAGAQELRARNL